jgi:hypothetical protein
MSEGLARLNWFRGKFAKDLGLADVGPPPAVGTDIDVS